MQTRHLRRADYTNYLKDDPIYLQAKAQTEERCCWVRKLEGWTTSSNLLVRLCGKIALVFAMAHDYFNREEIDYQINFSTVAKHYASVQKDPNLARAATWRYMFVHSDPQQTAVLLSLMHGGSFKHVEVEAQQCIKEETGLNVILRKDLTSVQEDIILAQTGTTGLSFALYYTIQIEKDGELITLGKLAVDGAYCDYDPRLSEPEIGTISFIPNYDLTVLKDAQKQTESFNYPIGTPDFKKHVKAVDLSYIKFADYTFTTADRHSAAVEKLIW